MDHDSIHTSRKTRAALEDLDGKIELHFLPASSPVKSQVLCKSTVSPTCSFGCCVHAFVLR